MYKTTENVDIFFPQLDVVRGTCLDVGKVESRDVHTKVNEGVHTSLGVGGWSQRAHHLSLINQNKQKVHAEMIAIYSHLTHHQ
jgi:hypothetical protein